MPYAPQRPCRHPGCPNFCKKGNVYCDEHNPEFSSEAMRGGAAERGYDSHWRTARAAYLRRNPLCCKCMEEGRFIPATVVDHIIPHRGNKELFWRQDNWQPLCKAHHDQKTGSGL